MANDVNINELDASDLSDILTEVKGAPTKVKNVAAARKELTGLLAEKSLKLETDEEGNFVLNPIKAAKAKAKPAPAPAPKAKAKAPEPEEDEEDEEEEEEVEAKPTKAKAKAAKDGDKPKRAPPSREPSHGNDSVIVIADGERNFKNGSIREALWAVMRKSKTVGDYMKKAAAHEREDVQATARGFLNVAVKDKWITLGG